MKKLTIGIIYEVVLATLVILSLTLDLETEQGKALDWFIWIVFVIDYTVRILNSDNKWQYFKDHPLDFIAILPSTNCFVPCVLCVWFVFCA